MQASMISVFIFFMIWIGLALWQTVFDQLSLTWTPLLFLGLVLNKTNVMWRYLGKCLAIISSFIELLPLEAFVKNLVVIPHTILRICFAAKEFFFGYFDMIYQMHWSTDKVVAGSLLLVALSGTLLYQYVLPQAWKNAFKQFIQEKPQVRVNRVNVNRDD